MSGKSKSRRESPDAAPGDALRDYVPFRIDTSAPTPPEGPRTPLFYVDDVEYSAPDRVSAVVALRALEIESRQGAGPAAYAMVVESLGEDAFRELTEGEAAAHLRFEDVQALFAELGRRYYGQMREMLGK